MREDRRPRIVVTVAVAAAQAEPDIAARKNVLYADAVERHGAVPVVLDATASGAEREAAFAAMDGLLLSGGADLDPARYGQPSAGAVDIRRAGRRNHWLVDFHRLGGSRQAPWL